MFLTHHAGGRERQGKEKVMRGERGKEEDKRRNAVDNRRRPKGECDNK
jgi:hypothetical protein